MARKKHSMVKVTMFITLIVAMNIIGISYGHWQEGLTSEVQVSTGYIEPYFSDKVEVKKSRDFNKLKASLKMDKRKEGNYVKLTGEIESRKKGKFTLDYTVCNNGSLPIKFDSEAYMELNRKLLSKKQGNFKILKDKPADVVIYPKDYKFTGKDAKGSLTLQIDAPEEAGEYEFEIEIPYKQWTGIQ